MLLLFPEEGDSNGKSEQSPETEESQTDEHGNQRDNRMKTQLHAHNSGFYIVTHHSDNGVNYQLKLLPVRSRLLQSDPVTV